MMLLGEAGLDSAGEQVALDEWLWREAEAGRLESDILRLWESASPAIVLGNGSRPQDECDTAQAKRDGVPIVRRVTGGAAVVCGPGCLMYSLVLHKDRFPATAQISTTHAFILGRLAQAIVAIGLPVQRAGTSDLVLAPGRQLRKFSGNSMRFGRQAVLYHGTLLYAMDLSTISRWLRHPPHEPRYRAGRPHGSFLVNLPRSRAALQQAVLASFPVEGRYPSPARSDLQSIIAARAE